MDLDVAANEDRSPAKVALIDKIAKKCESVNAILRHIGFATQRSTCPKSWHENCFIHISFEYTSNIQNNFINIRGVQIQITI